MTRHWTSRFFPRPLRRIILAAAGVFLLLAVAGYAFLAVRVGFVLKPAKASEPAPSSASHWDQAPPPLTAEELQYQRWFSAITWQLPRDQWDRHWKFGGRQYGFTSTRYQAAFTGYAAAALGMRTPAYPGLTRRILESTIEHLIDRRAWSYIEGYWKKEPTFPDPCAYENVMYTGHLMQLLALYEAMSGDSRYRTTGFDLVWNDRQKSHYDLMKLAEVSARQMRKNPSGGIPCEPGLIFFPCNNHPQVALLLMERMGLGNWEPERHKWETWALGSYRALAGEAAFRLFYHQPSKMFAPIGLPGGDAWSLLWYIPWATHEETPRLLWRQVKAKLDPDTLLAEKPPGAEKPSSCCAELAPLPTTASFLASAARACGDPATAKIFEAWLDHRFLKEEDGERFLDVGREWAIGVTANRALALAQANGSNLRQLCQSPLPRDYFQGPLLNEVQPASVAVFQAYRDGGKLILELDGGGADAALELAHLPAIERVEGIDASRWRYEGGVLRLTGLGHEKVAIVPAER